MKCRKCKEALGQEKVVYSVSLETRFDGSQYVESSYKTFYYCINEQCEHFQLLKIVVPKNEI